MIWRLAEILLGMLVVVRLLRLLRHESDVLNHANPRSTKLNVPASQNRNPYDILGISKEANSREIREAYLKKIQDYHPDKVSHLGQELQNLARIKTHEIMEAYNRLKEL